MGKKINFTLMTLTITSFLTVISCASENQDEGHITQEQDNEDVKQLKDLATYFKNIKLAKKDILPSAVQANEKNFRSVIYNISPLDNEYQNYAKDVTYTNFQLTPDDVKGILEVAFVMNLNSEQVDYKHQIIDIYLSSTTTDAS